VPSIRAAFNSCFALVICVVALAAGPAAAQQINGVLGEPGATTTINGNQIPAPEPKFGGVIKETLEGSKTWWPPRIVPPKGAPNILLIMTDDQGYGVPGARSAALFRRPRWIALPRRDCAMLSSTPPRCARRRERR